MHGHLNVKFVTNILIFTAWIHTGPFRLSFKYKKNL